MSLHNDILSITTDKHVENFPVIARDSFKNGHTVAKHEAAELALTYENLLDLIEGDLEDIFNHHWLSDATKECLDDILETIQKVRTGEYK